MKAQQVMRQSQGQVDNGFVLFNRQVFKNSSVITMRNLLPSQVSHKWQEPQDFSVAAGILQFSSLVREYFLPIHWRACILQTVKATFLWLLGSIAQTSREELKIKENAHCLYTFLYWCHLMGGRGGGSIYHIHFCSHREMVYPQGL